MKTFWQFLSESTASFHQLAAAAPPEWKAALPTKSNWGKFDLDLWMIYADWLEERGDPHAQEIRTFPLRVQKLEQQIDALADEDGGNLPVTDIAPEDVPIALDIIWGRGNRDIIEFSHFDQASMTISVPSHMDI